MTLTSEMVSKARGIPFSDPMVRAILREKDPKTQTRRVCRNWKVKGEYAIQDATHVVKYEPKGLPPEWSFRGPARFPAPGDTDSVASYGLIRCPYGVPGDLLYVKEVWKTDEHPEDFVDGIRFRADDRWIPIADTHRAAEAWVNANHVMPKTEEYKRIAGSKIRVAQPCRAKGWRSRMFMPRWVARIYLEITGVRVERVQAITSKDAWAEGVDCRTDLSWEGTTGTFGFYGKGYLAAFKETWDTLNGPRGFGWEANPWVWVVSFRRHTVLTKLGGFLA